MYLDFKSSDMKRKLKKLLTNPNRFFFDYFAKRLGASTSSIDQDAPAFGSEDGSISKQKFSFDEKVHPWVQVAKQFNLRSGATTGHPDQSMLIDSMRLFDLLIYIFWIANCFKVGVRIYTLGGRVNITIQRESLWRMVAVGKAYNEIKQSPDFVIEFIGEFDNNFAAHFFTFDETQDGLIVVRSDRAYVKKTLRDTFFEVYPPILNEFGNWAFGTPWPVDVVYTWVNKDDPDWREMWGNTFPDKPIDTDRYASKEELRYSLRALSKNMPWVHKIYIVSNCKKPEWLCENPKIKWVLHEEIFPDTNVLPVFNSHSIEACLHRITDLNEHFIYFNDDMFVIRPSSYYDFFDDTGRTMVQLENYGMVHKGNNFDETREFLSPAINSQILLQKRFPLCKATRLHKHTPYALKKSVLEEIEEIWAIELAQTRASKVRTPEDINLPSFFYHHYALATGNAILGDGPYLIVRPANIKKLKQESIYVYKFLCFNDGDGSANDNNYLEEYRSLMYQTYPKRGTFEIEHSSWSAIKISKTIMAYKARKNRIPYIRSMVGDAAVSLDDGRWGLWENSRRCWLSRDPASEFHLVIQDDAVICRDFSNRMSEIFANVGNDYKNFAYCLYFRIKNDSKSDVIANFNKRAIGAYKSKKSHFIDKYLRYGIAYMMPSHLVPEMIDYADKLDNLGNHDDTRYSHFAAHKGLRIVYPLASLIDQDPNYSSTHSNKSNKSLGATWFIDGFNGFKLSILSRPSPKSLPTANVFYWDDKANFGDEIGPWLIEKISKRTVNNIRKNKNEVGLMTVGSIVQQIDRPGMTIWGSGIIREFGKAKSLELSELKPKTITAVRGRLTRDYLKNKLGWDVPEIFGDPALLMPRYFNPPKLKYGVTLCPHYVHYAAFKESLGEQFEVIDVTTGVESVVSKIAGSTTVLSSSLHGIIIAQAYGIPWVWIRVDDAHLVGGDFKFEDFFSILDRSAVAMINVELEGLSSLSISSIAESARIPTMSFDGDALISALPKEYRPVS